MRIKFSIHRKQCRINFLLYDSQNTQQMQCKILLKYIQTFAQNYKKRVSCERRDLTLIDIQDETSQPQWKFHQNPRRGLDFDEI